MWASCEFGSREEELYVGTLQQLLSMKKLHCNKIWASCVLGSLEEELYAEVLLQIACVKIVLRKVYAGCHFD